MDFETYLKSIRMQTWLFWKVRRAISPELKEGSGDHTYCTISSQKVTEFKKIVGVSKVDQLYLLRRDSKKNQPDVQLVSMGRRRLLQNHGAGQHSVAAATTGSILWHGVRHYMG